MRSATMYGANSSPIHPFQSTRSMRSATNALGKDVKWVGISIHALHAERDDDLHAGRLAGLISIHALHAERGRKS